jgi:hypothetical protein
MRARDQCGDTVESGQQNDCFLRRPYFEWHMRRFKDHVTRRRRVDDNDDIAAGSAVVGGNEIFLALLVDLDKLISELLGKSSRLL